MDYELASKDIVRDLDTVGLGQAFALYCLKSRSWIHRAKDVSSEPPSDFGAEGYVAVLLGSQRRIAEVGGADSAQSMVQILSFLQDCVIDEVGYGWPEYHADGRYVALLAPLAVADAVWWSLDGESICPVGGLPSLPSGTIKLDA